MALPQVQKYLGWLRRYLYQVETGDLPPIIPTVELKNEPFDYRIINTAYSTVAGAISPIDVFSGVTEPESRAVVCWLNVDAAALPATDTVIVSVVKSGRVVPICYGSTSAALNSTILLVRTTANINGVRYQGAPPVVLNPGDRLSLEHISVAGGVAVVLRGLLLVLPRFAPFPDVF